MKNIIAFVLVLVSTFGFSQEAPKILKTEFTPEVLSQKIISQNGKQMTVADVIRQHENRILVIDFWASWCRDCILALPKTKDLKAQNPEVDFVYFSLDRSYDQWNHGLEKYSIRENENYWFDEGWRNKFNNYVDLNWVPRFMVIDQTGKIAKYYSISPEDPELLKTIADLKTKN